MGMKYEIIQDEQNWTALALLSSVLGLLSLIKWSPGMWVRRVIYPVHMLCYIAQI